MEQAGTAAVEDTYQRLFAAFPDARWASPRAYISGNVLIQEWVLTGTQKGDFGTITATNKPAGIHGASVYWFDDDGRIKWRHAYQDVAALGVQLGAAKGKARPVPALPSGEPEVVVANGSAEDNRFVNEAATFYSMFEKRDEKAHLGAFARDATRTSYLLPEDRRGEKSARDDFRSLTKAFPDLKVKARQIWGFGDRVIVETVTTGTLDGPYEGLKATKKPATLHALDILRFDQDGKIAEITTYGTLTELTAQP
jgi:predicted ester cyclase